MNSIDKFFKEWTDCRQTLVWGAFSMYAAISIILWGLFNTEAISSTTSTFPILSSLLFMLVLSAIISISDSRQEKNWFLGFVGWGKNWKVFRIASLAGIIFGYITVSKGLFVSTPLSVLGDPNFWLIVFAASYVEEVFFRYAVFPMVRQMLQTMKIANYSLIALFVVNGSFALFHWQAYGMDWNLLWIPFVMGCIYTIGNYFFKSTGFSQFAHFTNNLLIYLTVSTVI